MIRKAFVMMVNPDRHEEYEKRHNPIWPELEDALKQHGVRSYSIFLLPETTQLFAYAEIEDEARTLLEYATSLERVMVSTDKHLLYLAKQWIKEGRSFRLIWWEQRRTQRILLPTVLDAFDEIAANENAFLYPIEYLRLPK